MSTQLESQEVKEISQWDTTTSESTTQRRSHILNVCSSVIARVIGRAGSNINAIREATNAHIEVEKMTTRREQSTRQIIIKGTPDSIKYFFKIYLTIKKD